MTILFLHPQAWRACASARENPLALHDVDVQVHETIHKRGMMCVCVSARELS